MRSIGLALALLCAVACGAWATVPSTISYQGVVTDAGGNLVPDGSYDMTFRIYDVSVGGAPLYTEAHTGTNHVAVSKGGFGVVLGSLSPLTLAFDVPYYLGVEVGSSGELTPRVPLTAGPYSLSLRLPFAGAASGAGPALTISNPGGGPAVLVDPRLDVGSPTRSADIRWYQSGSAQKSGAILGIGSLGGDIETYDEVGNTTTALQPDYNGEGGFLYVPGTADGTKYMYVDGNSGAGSPTLVLNGVSNVTLNTSTTGDDAVKLPASSISAAEILDEPGLSQGIGAAQVSITSNTTFQDAVTTTITTPAAGYVVVEASTYATLALSSSNSMVSVQIDETAGGGVDVAHNVLGGMYVPPNIAAIYVPISTRRTYFKSAGTFTFRLEARREGNTDGSVVLNYPVITATYYPTSRGAVAQIVSGPEVAGFREARATTLRAADGTIESAAEVDLRELELRAATARADAERAELELTQARLREQIGGVAEAAARSVSARPERKP